MADMFSYVKCKLDEKGNEGKILGYFQRRVLTSTLFGYAFFYLVRKNLSIAFPYLQADLGISKVQFGVFLTLHGLTYGVSKYLSGICVDRNQSKAKHYLVCSLLLCSICSFIFGMSSSIIAFGILWTLMGLLQGFGYPPIAKILSKWYMPNVLSTKMSVWNSSHNIGTIAIFAICSVILACGCSWRWCFFIPSILAFVGVVYMTINIKSSPKKCGLPELVIPRSATKQSIYKDKRIWVLNIANFPVYVLRFMVIDWGVLMLKEYNGFSITHGALAIIGFELAGVIGILLSGVITDKFLKHSSQRACAIGMGGATLSLLLFYALKYTHPFIYISALVLCGFFIYIPQAAGGIAVAKIGTQSDAGKAVGLHGLFGYIPTAFTSTVIAFITQSYGWSVSLICVVLTGIIGTILFASLWNTKSDGY